MKRIIATFVLAAAVLVTASCSKDDAPFTTDIDKHIEFTIKADNEGTGETGNNVSFNNGSTYSYTETLHGNYTLFSAFTYGKIAHDVVSITIKTDNCRKIEPGSMLEITEFSFCKPLSSNSRDYTQEFTGRIYLVKYPQATGEDAAIRFHNVKCTLGGPVYGGTYTLNGDLTFKTVSSPMN